MNGALVFLPLYFQYVQGQTPTHAGLMLLAQIAGMISSSFVGGRLSAGSGEFKTYFLVGVGFSEERCAIFAAENPAVDLKNPAACRRHRFAARR